MESSCKRMFACRGLLVSGIVAVCALVWVLLIAVTLVIPPQADACTTVIVGRQASADGSRIIARTEDAEGNNPKRLVSYSAQTRTSDWVYTDQSNGFTCTLPAESYQYVAVPDMTCMDSGEQDEATVNAKQICATATESIYANDAALAADPLVADGVSESNILTIVIPYVSSAREGVERLGSLVDRYGIDEGSGVVFADDDETWYMEIYSGHQWAAIRFPDDCYAVIGNDGLIGCIDVNDTDNVIVSDGLVSLAKDNGFYQEKDGLIDTTATYCESKRDYSQIRVWGGHRLFSPSQTGDYDVNETYNMLMEPDEKITLENVMEFTRYRFEDTIYDVNEHPEIRAVGIVRTAEAHVFWLRDGKPQIMWVALANPEMSVYIPFYGNITQFPDAFSKDTYSTDETTAYWKYRRLSTLAVQGRDTYGKTVRDTWKKLESSYITGIDVMDERYEGAGESGSEAAAIFEEISDEALASADNMFDDTLSAMADAETQDGTYDSSLESYGDLI